MISNHLSLIEPLRAKSDELAAQVAEFVAAGGKIEEAEAQNYKYKCVSYSNQMPPAPKPLVRRRVEAAPLPLARSNIRVQERLKLVERVRCLAVNHPKIEVAAELGIDRRTVSKIGKEFGITFKAPSRGGTRNLVPKRVDDAKDARLAERIKEFMALGITRRQCCGKLAIGAKAFERIIAVHSIDYPKASQGSTSCAA